MHDDELRTVRLYGRLGARFGRTFRLAVRSPAEAVRALSCMMPGFEAAMMAGRFAVFIDKRNIGADELRTEGRGDIRIAPVLAGAKSGWGQIIVGVVIVAAATIFTAGTLTPAAIAATAGGTGLAATAVMVGGAMIAGGVAQLLAPNPAGLGTQDGPDNGASYRFNGPANTTAQGNPVPILYGELIIGSAVINGAIVAEDQQ